MKSNDILNALGSVDEKYKKEAFEENADNIFDKSKKTGEFFMKSLPDCMK